MCYCPTPTLHLNLALTGDGAFLLSPQKTYSVWFISVLNYGDTENVLINHLLLVIPVSYPCHKNLCPHKSHKHAPPPIHTQTSTHTRTHARIHTNTTPPPPPPPPPTHTHTKVREHLDFVIYIYYIYIYYAHHDYIYYIITFDSSIVKYYCNLKCSLNFEILSKGFY